MPSPPNLIFFNEEILAYLKTHKNALTLTEFKQSTQGFLLFIVQKKGLTLIPRIPFLGDKLFPGSTTITLAAQDAIPVPLCLLSVKGRRAATVAAVQNLFLQPGDPLVLQGVTKKIL